MSDYGIDVSSFNTITDWSAVRGAGNSWAWSKATQGSTYTNPLFASQMVSGRNAGLCMGAYHFPDPRVSVAANVAKFVAVAGPRGAFNDGAFVPMLDVENSTGDGITWSAQGANSFIPAFRDALRQATGQQLLCVYAPESWWAAGFLQPAQWADSGVFLAAAQYTGVPGQLGWSNQRLAVHQYTNSAPTPGATGVTDRSVLVGGWTLADLTVGGDMPLTQADANLVAETLLDMPLTRAGNATGTTSLRAVLCWSDSNLDGISAAVKAAVTQEESDLLAAIKALPAASVDVNALAKALADGGLPAQLVAALLAVLQKAEAAA